MCATPCLKGQALLAVLPADVAGHASIVAAPAAVAKGILSAPTPRAVIGTPAAAAALPAAVAKMAGTVIGMPALVAKKAKLLVARDAKVSKVCAPAMADVAILVEVVAAPVLVPKAKVPNESVPGPFHPPGIVVEIVGTEMGDQGHSCEEHTSNCGKVIAKDVVVCLWKCRFRLRGRRRQRLPHIG
jgi:hypothetical protein